MRVLPAVALLLVSLTAGCFGGGDDDPPGTGDPPTTPTPTPGGGGNNGGTNDPPEPATEYSLMSQFTFDGCSGIRFQYLMDPDDAATLVPDTYTPSLFSTSSDIPLEEVQRAELNADLFNCTSFTAGSFAFENVWFGIISIPVEAPADAVEADSHGYIIQMVGGEDVLAAIWPVAGYPTNNGTVAFEDFTTTQRMSAGDYQWDVVSTAPGDGATSGTFTWYHELEESGDRLTWTGTQDIPAGNGGAASLTFPSNAPFAGLEPIPGQPLSGQGSYVVDAAFTGMDLVRELAAGRA